MRPDNNQDGSEFDPGTQVGIANLAMKFFIGAIAVFVLIYVVSVVLRMFGGTDVGGEPADPVREVSLGEVASDYMKNEVRADAKYEHSFITTGRVRRIDGNGFLELAGGGRNHVEAFFDNKNDLLQIDRGDSISLLCHSADGSSDSLGAFVSLRKCSLVSNGQK